MKAKIIRALQFIRLLDENGQLSITFLGFLIGAFCVLFHRPLGVSDLAVFAVALASYRWKRSDQRSVTAIALDAANEAALTKLNAEAEIAKEAARADTAATKARLDRLEELIRAEGSHQLQEAFRKSKVK